MARPRVVVEAGIEPVHAQRIAVVAVVGFRGAVQAQAGGVAAVAVGEAAREVVAAALAVGDVFALQQPAAGEVEHHNRRCVDGSE